MVKRRDYWSIRFLRHLVARFHSEKRDPADFFLEDLCYHAVHGNSVQQQKAFVFGFRKLESAFHKFPRSLVLEHIFFSFSYTFRFFKAKNNLD